MSKYTDKIMALAHEMADVKAAHALAVHEFAADRADYAPVKKLSEQFVAAEKALRSAAEEG